MSAGKMKTLFSYFTKSPSTPNNAVTSSPKPFSEVRRPGISTTPKTAKKRQNNSVAKHVSTVDVVSQETNHDSPFEMYDLVWAKVDGYPWWPGIVCKSPSTQNYIRKKTTLEVHVQFFDDINSRAWLQIKNLKLLTGPKHAEIPVLKDVNWKQAVTKAMDALNNLPKDARNELIAPMQLSDNEEDTKDYCSNSDDAISPIVLSKKRKLVNGASFSGKRQHLSFSDESGEEFTPDVDHESDSESVSSGVDESMCFDELQEQESDLDVHTAVKETKRKKKTPLPTSKKVLPKKLNGVDESTKARVLNFSFEENTSPGKLPENKVWKHLELDWLNDDKRKDASGKSVCHPDHNPRTLHIPDSFKKNLTPALRQWWEMKSRHYDCVLFFKVGKFYELYHMDAVIGVSELNLTFMKGDFAHSGFPEIAYGRFSSALIERGYKVARVEQTETPNMMEERCKKMGKATKFDKVVNREICSITTKGTLTYNFLDGKPSGVGNNYLLSLTEISSSKGGNIVGVCFVDTSIGKFHLGQFEDDRHGSRLRTLISHFPPVQVLYEREAVSTRTQQIFSGCLSGVVKEGLKSGTEFWDSSKTVQFLTEGGYFTEGNNPDDKLCWPEILKMMLNPDDSLMLTASESYNLAFKALGACIWYLCDCFKEEELLSLKSFEEYIPADYEPRKAAVRRPQRSMVLDSVTLRNLEILENSSGALEGSLLETMDFCCTQFGKRLFRQWLCAPSCDPHVIEDRLNAVTSLRSMQDVVADAVKMMKKLPDLERLLSKIHTQGSARRSKSHPDSRAIFFEEGKYSKRKISDLLSALNGFKTGCDIISLFVKKKKEVNSEILRECVTFQSNDGHFPDLRKTLDFFDDAFDHEKAKADGKIIPNEGVDAEFDDAEREIKKLKLELDKYLEEQKRHFGCKVTYYGSGKNRFQLEVPENAVKNASEKYELRSQKKGFKRYWTSEIKLMLFSVVLAEEHRTAALKDIMRRIFENFDKNYKKWEAAVHCLSVLDIFLSLMQYSLSSQVPMCRPEVLVLDDNEKRFLEIREGRHPSLLKYFADEFIPNDIIIGNSSASKQECPLVLVTGPNMGGKSTLMRQVGLLAVMAQMGSYVPAVQCRFTVIDRIFTRLGASDRIMMGESTFFVELSETATILQHATKHSFVILDELGRGTSTYDGTAIACSVVKELSTNISCLTLFSTHYHCLVDEFSKDSNVRLGHMACMVENENEDPTQETITFLYKFKDGACPKSYGFNAARLAGIPDVLIRKGSRKAKRFEEEFVSRKNLRILLSCASVCGLKTLQRSCL